MVLEREYDRACVTELAVELISDESRSLIFELIMLADQRHGLKLKGGLIGLGLVGGNGYKLTSDQARDKFKVFFSRIRWDSRAGVLEVLPFLTRAYALVPRSELHDRLDQVLLADGLRIRDGELRRLVARNSNNHPTI